MTSNDDCLMKRKLVWTPAKVGCYWNSGRFHIEISVLIENGREVLTFPKSAYVLTHDREQVGRFKTLKAAQRAAERMKTVITDQVRECPTLS